MFIFMYTVRRYPEGCW